LTAAAGDGQDDAVRETVAVKDDSGKTEVAIAITPGFVGMPKSDDRQGA